MDKLDKPSQKEKKKPIFLLLAIIFSHALGVCLSTFYDQAIYKKDTGRHEFLGKTSLELDNIRYWARFFTYWSAWTSLWTIPWAIIKLIRRKKSKTTFGEQLLDLMVGQSNLLSGGIFCTLFYFFSFPREAAKRVTPIKFWPSKLVDNFPSLFPAEIKIIWAWCLYNFFWHVLSPALVIYYFWHYSQVNLIAKKKKSTFYFSTFNPIIYFIYLLDYPEIFKYKYYHKPPHKYPHDYPYPPFYWLRGKSSKGNEEDSFLGIKWKHSAVSAWVWAFITISFWMLIFTELLHILIAIKQVPVIQAKKEPKKRNKLLKLLPAPPIKAEKPAEKNCELTVSIDDPKCFLSEETLTTLEKILQLAVEKANYSVAVHLSLVGKKASQQLNRQYRKINKSTDVLTFPFYESYHREIDLTAQQLRDLGDIIICYPLVVEQASTNQQLPEKVLYELFLHSLLNLLVSDYENSSSETNLTDAILTKLGLNHHLNH